VRSSTCKVDPKPARSENPIDVDQRDLGHTLLQHADARFHKTLTLFGGVIFRVFAQIAQFACAFDFPWELQFQLAIERLDLVFELFDKPILHRHHGLRRRYHSAMLQPWSGSRVDKTASSCGTARRRGAGRDVHC
jgi:hypothetical protein